MTVDPLASSLAEVVGDGNVLTDDDVRAGYEVDWTRRWRGRARLVVRPSSAAQVAAVVRSCAAAGAAIVPQGGNTGLVGGGVPRSGEVVLSTARLQTLDDVDQAGPSVTAGAGVPLASVQRAAQDVGLVFGVDLAARDSATVGGMVATDAGGTQVVRYGSMRAQVLGLEAVLADGSVMDRLHRPAKTSSGYDLVSLLAGSEGTLGIITRVRLRLVPESTHRAVALLGVDGPAAAVGLVASVRRSVPSLVSLEVFHANGLDLVCRTAGLPQPLPVRWPTYVLIEAAGAVDPLPELHEVLAPQPEPAVAITADSGGRARLWAYRDRHTEAISTLGVPHKLDISIPLERLPAFEDDVRHAIGERWPTAVVITFGHLAEGNLHVNIIGPDPADDGVDDAVLELVVAAGGSISAEHGIGVAKRTWLQRSLPPGELAALRAIKAAMDPSAMLNPGVIL